MPQVQVKEECSHCGSLLIETLRNRSISSFLLQQEPIINTTQESAKGLSSEFQTAYRQVESSAPRLALDIEKVDLLLNLRSHGSLCIIGEHDYTQLLIDRICVHFMLPKRHGGIGEGYSKIIAIDASNCSDVYKVVDFARQYGLEKERVLQNMVVSRVFTIYQLAHLVTHELPKIIKQLSYDKNGNVIVIYGLLHLFVSDPHIDKTDAKQLVKEIAASIRMISEDRFVVVSTANCNPSYEKTLFPVFDNVVNITNDIENGRVLHVEVRNQNHHKGGKGTHSTISTKICKQYLSLIPSR